MSTRFHNTKDGPKPCTAEKRACPVSVEHYDNEGDAAKAYEAEMGGSAPKIVSKHKSLPRVHDLSNSVVQTRDNGHPLNKMTASQARQCLVTAHKKFRTFTPEIEEGIKDALGLPEEVEAESLELNSNGEINVRTIEHIPSYSLDNGHNPMDNVDPEYTKSDYYKYSEARYDWDGNVEGYTHIYNAPDEYQEFVQMHALVKHHEEAVARANNPALPDWAVHPVTATTNAPPRNKWDNATHKPRQQVTSWRPYTDTDLPEPKAPPQYPTAKISELKRKLSGDEEVQRLERLRDLGDSRIKKLEEFKADIENHKKDAPHLKYMRGKGANALKKHYESLDSRLRSEKGLVKSHIKQIDELTNYTDSDKEKMQQELDQREAEWAAKNKEYKTKKLSYHYPSNDEATRMKAAENWVEEHPEILDTDWENHDW